MSWSGLRGAVSLCVAVIVDNSSYMPEIVKDTIVFQVAFLVLASSFINGTMASFIYKQLQLSRPVRQCRRAYRYLAQALYELAVARAYFLTSQHPRSKYKTKKQEQVSDEDRLRGYHDNVPLACCVCTSRTAFDADFLVFTVLFDFVLLNKGRKIIWPL